MKSILTAAIALLVFVFLSFVPVSISHGQTAGEAPTGLLLENQKRPMNSVRVKEGKTVFVQLKDNRTYKGQLSEVHEDGMRIDSIDFSFADIQSMRLPGMENTGAKMSGKVLIIIGLIGMLVGALMSAFGFQGLNSAADCGRVVGLIFLALFGIAIGATAIIFLLVGLIAVAVGARVGKNYKLGSKWRLRKADPSAP
jgi:hypothetical protein